MEFNSALAARGEHPRPAGTLQELREAGLDLMKCGSCAAKKSGVRGCEFHSSKDGAGPGECLFDRPQFGNFKNKGPRNVGVYVKLSGVDGGRQQHLQMPCHAFIRTLKARMLAGQFQRMNGADGEIIRVIKQEGETIMPRIWIQVEPPSKEYPNGRWDVKRNEDGSLYTEVVARHPRPNEIEQNNWEQAVWEDEVKRQRALDSMFTEPVPTVLDAEYDDIDKLDINEIEEPLAGDAQQQPLA